MALFWVQNRTEAKVTTDDCYNAFRKTDEHGERLCRETDREVHLDVGKTKNGDESKTFCSALKAELETSKQ